MNTDEFYMARCLQLAKNGELGAAPNPMVGAVIVHDGKIIGEGYHIRCGGPHAEVNAFRSVKDDSLLSESTMYVSLEPCAHFGHTPPCADLIVKKGVRRVVIGCMDPFSKVQGRGIRILRTAGIELRIGVLNNECQFLNRRFITFNTCHRPYITLKWAHTSDGVMGIKPDANGANERLMISSTQTQRRAHHLRACHSAILVGRNTALCDNPSLTTRLVDGPSPLRIVIDPYGKLQPELALFDGTVPTLVVGYRRKPCVVERPNVEFLRIDKSGDLLDQLLAALYERKVQSVLVEGGAKVLQHFIERGLWDEAHVECSSQTYAQLSGNLPKGRAVHAPTLDIKPMSTEQFGSLEIKHYYCHTPSLLK